MTASPRSLHKVILVFCEVQGIEPKALCTLDEDFIMKLYVYFCTSLKTKI